VQILSSQDEILYQPFSHLDFMRDSFFSTNVFLWTWRPIY